MPAKTADRLAAQPFTYTEQGGTAWPEPPDGYAHLAVRSVVGTTDADFERAATRILTWQMHERAGLRVIAAAPEAQVGTHVVVGIGLGPLRIDAPCRVVNVAREPDRAGFTYGTLPGHPEAGEEAFYVERDEDGTVLASVTVFARPARWFTKLAGPLLPVATRIAAKRYVDALR